MIVSSKNIPIQVSAFWTKISTLTENKQKSSRSHKDISYLQKFVRNVAYKELPSHDQKSRVRPRVHPPDDDDSEYEEISHLNREQLEERMGLPNNIV